MPVVHETPRIEVIIQCLSCGSQLKVTEVGPGELVIIPDHDCLGTDQRLADLAAEFPEHVEPFDIERWESEGGQAR